MSAEVLQDIEARFEQNESRERDEQWLPRGFTHILRTLLNYDNVNEATLWATALLMTVMERGGSCLPLSLISGLREVSRIPEAMQRMTVEEWKVQLRGDVFGDGLELVRPLVVENDRLYFDRFLRLERDVAQRLMTELDPGALRQPESWNQIIDDIFEDDESSRMQREAALNLFKRRVAILAGGPGTGKTTTVANMLVALHKSTNGDFSVKLCAPTGKAAQRIKESLAIAVAKIDASLTEAIVGNLTPTTIHKLLGIRPGAARRQQSAHLHVDFVICDETSMVDLALLDELLRAIAPETRLLLVGDPNQLQSVDVGTVMSDLVAAMRFGLGGTTLETVFRVSNDGSLDEAERNLLMSFFRAIRDDEITLALGLLTSGSGVLQLIEAGPRGNIEKSGESAIQDVVTRAHLLADAAERSVPTSEWKPILESTMVLAAQHHGPLSRTWWVERVARELEIHLGATPSTVGTPVLITATDHANGLTNGDSGLIVRNDLGRSVYIPTTSSTADISDDAASSALSPAAIHAWQPWWAMTIHKSQGSEFDEVVVSVTPGTRLLSKELLYTAVTRAKRKVVVVGRIEDIELALNSPAKRFSGLAEIIEKAKYQKLELA